MSGQLLLFCHPYRHYAPTPQWNREVEAADAINARYYSICAEQVFTHDFEAALESLPETSGASAIYRGGILTEETYERLYEELEERNYPLLVNPSAYNLCLQLPNYYSLVEEFTNPTVWTESRSLEEAWQAAQELGEPPYIVKDHIKSVEEAFSDACWIKQGADKTEFFRVCQNLLDFRDDQFTGGIVIRKPSELVRLSHQAEGFPIYDEHRVFYYQGSPILHAPYFDEHAKPLNLRELPELGDLIDSPFFVADFARLKSGGWLLLELNDGGTSGVPPTMDPRELFEALEVNQ